MFFAKSPSIYSNILQHPRFQYTRVKISWLEVDLSWSHLGVITLWSCLAMIPELVGYLVTSVRTHTFVRPIVWHHQSFSTIAVQAPVPDSFFHRLTYFIRFHKSHNWPLVANLRLPSRGLSELRPRISALYLNYDWFLVQLLSRIQCMHKELNK